MHYIAFISFVLHLTRPSALSSGRPMSSWSTRRSHGRRKGIKESGDGVDDEERSADEPEAGAGPPAEELEEEEEVDEDRDQELEDLHGKGKGGKPWKTSRNKQSGGGKSKGKGKGGYKGKNKHNGKGYQHGRKGGHDGASSSDLDKSVRFLCDRLCIALILIRFNSSSNHRHY